MHRPSAFAARFARASLLVAAATLLASCELMQAPASPTASRRDVTPAPAASATPIAIDEVPTLRPEPSGQFDLIGAADALADLKSYRVSVLSRGLVPSSAADGRVTMTSTLVQGNHPAATFTVAGVDGFDGLASGVLHAVVIGEEAWLRSGTGRWVKSPGGAADFDALFTALSPTELVGNFESLGPAFVKIGPETKNGSATDHYRVDVTSPAASDAGLTSGGVDAWIASRGGALIAIVADGTVDVDGTATPVVLRIDVTHIDDPANKVRPPV